MRTRFESAKRSSIRGEAKQDGLTDDRLIALVGDSKPRIDAIVEEKRESVYAQPDGFGRNSEVNCAGLEKA